ncbi:MAG TPA: type II toxin-antitoxin system RelE/ParE family toxin [Thermoanaerobaculia bacterium]|nr:type II toxin-antitoxin system RelE/ParE family toxin [Thermoanaerobaculia bacterium]
MIGYSYHPKATLEIIEAIRYYEERAPGLGRELRAELDDAVLLLRQVPESAAPIRGGLRRKPLRRFPFALIYAVEESEIRIYAVSHRRRRPGYWLDRLPR